MASPLVDHPNRVSGKYKIDSSWMHVKYFCKNDIRFAGWKTIGKFLWEKSYWFFSQRKTNVFLAHFSRLSEEKNSCFSFADEMRTLSWCLRDEKVNETLKNFHAKVITMTKCTVIDMQFRYSNSSSQIFNCICIFSYRHLWHTTKSNWKPNLLEKQNEIEIEFVRSNAEQNFANFIANTRYWDVVMKLGSRNDCDWSIRVTWFGHTALFRIEDCPWYDTRRSKAVV